MTARAPVGRRGPFDPHRRGAHRPRSPSSRGSLSQATALCTKELPALTTEAPPTRNSTLLTVGWHRPTQLDPHLGIGGPPGIGTSCVHGNGGARPVDANHLRASRWDRAHGALGPLDGALGTGVQGAHTGAGAWPAPRRRSSPKLAMCGAGKPAGGFVRVAPCGHHDERGRRGRPDSRQL